MRWNELFIILIIFGFIWHPRTVTSNPLPAFWDLQPEGSPFPVNSTQIFWNQTFPAYLKSEIINVTFYPDLATINANYTFENLSPNTTTLQILLPFANIPTNISLTRAGENITHIELYEIPYSDHSTDDSLMIPINLSTMHVTSIQIADVIQFQLTFTGLEEITLSTTYQREYAYRTNHPDESKYYYNEFRYIIGSTRWWNHTLDSAYFEFRIKNEEYETGEINGIDFNNKQTEVDSQVIHTTDFMVLSAAFTDWLPDGLYLKIHWLTKKAGGIVSYPGFIVLISSIWISLWKKGRKIKEK